MRSARADDHSPPPRGAGLLSAAVSGRPLKEGPSALLWVRRRKSSGLMSMPLASAHYLHWGWIQVSPANLIVIVLMLITFAAAVLLKMPAHRQGRRHDDD